jgi:small conductance mechanosensitive channel
MAVQQLLGNRKVFNGLIGIFAIIFIPISITGVLAQDKKSQPAPVTTKNPDISIQELEYRLQPLTKDDLAVEAEEWLQVLKKQVEKVSETQIKALTAEGDAKTELLESVTKLQEKQTALADHLKAVIAEFKLKGGEIVDYEAYLTAIAGVKVDVADAGAAWTVITGWLMSSEGGLRWAKNIVFFLIIILLSYFVSNLIGKAVQRAIANIQSASELLKDFIVNICRKAILVVGFVVALSMLEVNVGPLLAAIGAAGFIMGFALQGTLSNFASGIKVDAMTVVSTTLRKVDNQKVVIPNNMIWGDIITNITGTSKRRVDMVFGIGYSDDMAKAQEVLEEILANHEAILKDPAPVVKVHELADSSVNFVVRPWVETDNYWDVYWDITRSVKERFDAAGVSIPFPQQDVHMHQVAST